jgi:hypothetical protein
MGFLIDTCIWIDIEWARYEDLLVISRSVSDEKS